MTTMSSSARGKCMDMCPPDEIRMREKEHLLHVLEMVPGTEKTKSPKANKERMVKCFSRSAAGRQIKEGSIRPPAVLLKTVKFLLNDVINSTTPSWPLVYDYITDRLMAVRQDTVIQDIPVAENIAILQPIVRFHAFAAYKLCNEKISNFDPTLNNNHLQECLKRLLSLYDSWEVCNSPANENRPEFEALYLIFNAGNEEALRRGVSLQLKHKTDVVKTSITMSLCCRYGNFVKYCRLIKKLPMLLSAVATLQLPKIRKRAFHVMSVAYHSKTLSFPVNILQKILFYGSVDDVLTDCRYYGIQCDNEHIYFTKQSFIDTKHTVSPRHEYLVDIKKFVLELN